MKRLTRKVILVLLSVFIVVNAMSMTSFAEEKKAENDSVLRFSRTMTASKSGSATYRVPEGYFSIGYTVSGNYVYDVNASKITSAYGTKLASYWINSTPGGQDWDLSIRNITYGTPIVGPNGSYAQFSIHFDVYGRPAPGTLPLRDYDYLGTEYCTVTAYAQ